MNKKEIMDEAKWEKHIEDCIPEFWWDEWKDWVNELLVEARQEAIEECYNRIKQAFVYEKKELINGMYSDEDMRGASRQTVYLIDKGGLLTDDLFLELAIKNGDAVMVGRHRQYNPKKTNNLSVHYNQK